MFDIGWSEFFIIVVVTLLILGPRDLPHVLHHIARFIRHVRSISRVFQGHIDHILHQADLDDIKKYPERIHSFNLKQEMENLIDSRGTSQQNFTPPPKIDAVSSQMPSDASMPPTTIHPTQHGTVTHASEETSPDNPDPPAQNTS